nr:hypothetical protein [Streptomyces sp. 846.5]
MPKNQSTAAKKARQMQAATGLAYTEALQQQARPWWEPSPDEPEDITAAEYGVHALDTHATPPERARAEALWRPREDTAARCRCSGICRHGETCDEPLSESPCGGHYIHTDRHPGSLFTLTEWFDTYECDRCDTQFGSSVTLLGIPWGELVPNPQGGSMTVVYDDVRHPNFSGWDEQYPDGDHDPDADDDMSGGRYDYEPYDEDAEYYKTDPDGAM